MKIRNGFVSNSSSSSFLIVCKSTERCPHCGRSDPNFLDILPTDNCGDDSYLRARGFDDVTSYIKGNFSLEVNKWTNAEKAERQKEEYNESVERIKSACDKGEVAYISISHHDHALEEIFDQMVKTGAIEIIEDHS